MAAASSRGRTATHELSMYKWNCADWTAENEHTIGMLTVRRLSCDSIECRRSSHFDLLRDQIGERIAQNVQSVSIIECGWISHRSWINQIRFGVWLARYLNSAPTRMLSTVGLFVNLYQFPFPAFAICSHWDLSAPALENVYNLTLKINIWFP